MKNIAFLLTALSGLFLTSCASTGGSCCGTSAGSMKACCKAAAAKGMTCEVCHPKKM